MDKQQAFARLTKAVEYLKDNGKARTHEEIAELTTTSRANVTSALNGNPRYVTKNFLHRFAIAYSDYINEDWLLTGDGDMKVIDKNMRPHFPATVSAGVLGGIAEDVMKYNVEYEPRIKKFPDYDFIIDIKGDSMIPKFRDGDSVACKKIDRNDELIVGNVYIFLTHDGAVLKSYQSKTLSSIRVKSYNPIYKPYSIPLSDIIQIYKVVGTLHVPSDDDVIDNPYLKLFEGITGLQKSPSGQNELSNLERDQIKKIINVLSLKYPDLSTIQ